MNKLTKIGVSALCGSLASVASAYAGAIEVTGSANATWLQKSWGTTGNPIGQKTALSFKGTGELDGGQTFTATMDLGDKGAWSDSSLAVTTNSLGTFTLNGSGLDRLDDEMPNALATAGDTTSTGLITVTGAGEQGVDIEWTISEDFLPEGMKAYVAYTPKANGSSVPADKATGGDSKSSLEDGWDVVIDHTGLADGLRIFAGYGHLNDATSDRNSWAAGATYAVGGVTVGYQHSNESLDSGGTDAYVNDAYGVSFAVNDDLSISYGHHESERDVLTGANVTQESDSIQLSYTMGGATIAISESETSKAAYSATATDQEATLVSLTLAF